MVQLELYGKDEATRLNRAEPVTLDAEHVPRIGEILDLSGAVTVAPGEPTTFIVTDALWLHRDGQLVPTLKCMQWHKGNRRRYLSDEGWC